MFIGREEELAILSQLWGKSCSSLVTCRGRRRIGKSRLIEEFALRSKADFICIDGLAPRPGLDNAAQLLNFHVKLSTYSRVSNRPPENWFEAFLQLNACINDEHRTVVLLDELSWMGIDAPDFPGYLKSAWDMHFKKHDRLIMVLCGSVSTWINENILNSTAFVGRRSCDMFLGELPLTECVSFWGSRQSRWSTNELTAMLSVTGGVPRYLEEINTSLTADENLRQMCFTPTGILYQDFPEIFNDTLGGNYPLKRKLLQGLACQSRSASQLAQDLQHDNNGYLCKALQELETAGFIRHENGLNPQTGMPLRENIYRLIDNYTRFYLRCLAPHKEQIKNATFVYAGLTMLPGWETILGLQFETMILNNLRSLLPLIGLDKTLILSAAPYYHKAGKTSRGCQIDLLIQTKSSLYVIEIKRQARISASVAKDVEAKIEALPHQKNKSIRTVLIYDGELAPTVHYDNFFDYLIPVDRLLGRLTPE